MKNLRKLTYTTPLRTPPRKRPITAVIVQSRFHAPPPFSSIPTGLPFATRTASGNPSTPPGNRESTPSKRTSTFTPPDATMKTTDIATYGASISLPYDIRRYDKKYS